MDHSLRLEALTLSGLKMLFFMFQDENEEETQLNAAEKSLCILILPLAHFQCCLSLDFNGRVKSP